MGLKLYEINEQLAHIDFDNIVDGETGEVIDKEALEKLNKLSIAKEEKEINIALLIKNLKAEAEAINIEKNKLANREKVINNKIKWLEAYLMTSLDGAKINDPRVSVSYRAGFKIVSNNPLIDKIPPVLLRISKPEINKAEIKNQLKEEILTEDLLKQWNIIIDRAPSMIIK